MTSLLEVNYECTVYLKMDTNGKQLKDSIRRIISLHVPFFEVDIPYLVVLAISFTRSIISVSVKEISLLSFVYNFIHIMKMEVHH